LHKSWDTCLKVDVSKMQPSMGSGWLGGTRKPKASFLITLPKIYGGNVTSQSSCFTNKTGKQRQKSTTNGKTKSRLTKAI
jgi:hypothetical protein